MSINNVDWQKIDTFDENVAWQKSLAVYIHEFSKSFARRFGEEHEEDEEDCNRTEWDYKDNIVKINSTVRLFPNGKALVSTRISLVPLNTQVFSAYFMSKDKSYTIDSFRVGSWLNHMESLRLRLEPIEKAEEEKRKQQEAQQKARNFGRLD